jgi:hypothetical protein
MMQCKKDKALEESSQREYIVYTEQCTVVSFNK